MLKSHFCCIAHLLKKLKLFAAAKSAAISLALRQRSGKGARLKAVQFDRESVNSVRDVRAEEEAARLKEEAKKEAEVKSAEKGGRAS